MIFLRFVPFLVCVILFGIGILIGAVFFLPIGAFIYFSTSYFFKHRFRSLHSAKRRYIFEVGKAADQLVCALIFKGNHDETISNRAGKIFLDKGFHSPWWVIFIKKLTDVLDPPKNGKCHIEDSIEPLRPNIFDDGA